jgi:hypothetical protein
VARIARSYEAIWLGDNSWLSAADVPLKTGQQLRLEAGCAEIVFASGARLIVQGPATLRVAGSKAASLSAGKVAVTVPRQASGFAVWTPIGTVVDLGTEFGLKVGERGSSEIHVFAGVVELQMADRTGGRHRLALAAGQAVRVWLPAETAHARIEQVATEANGFVRDLPPRQVATGSVAALRSFAREHPDLIHHYPFEGSTPAEICRDCRGTMRLVETVMHGGRGDGRIVYASEGADKTTRAIQPARSGNAMGVALQTEDAFQPPASMTVEMLVNFARFEVWDEDSVAVALGTRADDQRCGFFAVAAAGGQFVQLFDAGGPWLESGVVLHPGEWYYVASTFRSDSDKTVVNTYLANITREDRGLYHAVRNRTVRGVPATGRLGVGKGFDWEGAHAYPWSGSIDEVAIYAAVLDQKELERHLAAIYPNQVGK